jgi:HPt (histidine-containing phosphotransfer) domain-containing protein
MQIPKELKQKYLKRRIQDIQNLRTSLDKGDYSLAIKLGHQVKGNAVTFDMPHMAHIGREMEQAAQIQDKEKVKNLIFKMESFIHSEFEAQPTGVCAPVLMPQ